MATDNVEPRALQPTILSFVKDLPNLCSLAAIKNIWFSCYILCNAFRVNLRVVSNGVVNLSQIIFCGKSPNYHLSISFFMSS